ncbi:unnamed protein product [Danaus chrysippus]|uniref:(African queen) hypothetical protein n=1 Tax=Danaus chrysippus TaxID=151541 RepID=A0A8J2R3A4_9NEOP|nr:unnamed protein product [Danaus chrysippus]
MKSSVEVRCIVCHRVFCCGKCRWNHERATHGLTYDCPICRGHRFLCQPQELTQDFIEHLTTEHLPLQCKKCNKFFLNMEDLVEIDKCTNISELLNKDDEPKKEFDIDEKFDSLYEKINSDGDNFEAIISVNNSTKTAVITPIVRKKYLVDYESSESEGEEENPTMTTPHPKILSKTPAKTPKLKRQRAATPHIKKIVSLMRQKVVDEYEETVDENFNESSLNNKTTSCTTDNIHVPEDDKEMTTPTSHLPHVIKLAQIVTTSTPTHPAAGAWFSAPGNDSPLSEIETADSPAQSIDKEASKADENIPKLKSIIAVGSHIKFGSQDSTDKQVTFQDSTNNTETSVKTKKVKFADDTIFKQEPKIKRVFRKPKRMLTPGPQRPRFTHNPRFQALVNRFENQALTLARTPLNTKELKEKHLEDTPPAIDHNLPARAISFKDDSPVVDSGSQWKENELFRTCVDSPIQPINNAITTLTANIAGSLQTCLTSVLRSTSDETEIQFKFVITKKTVSVKRIAEDGGCEKATEIEREDHSNKENIWSSVARAVKNVFWGSEVTPHKPITANDSTSSSKRKFDEISDNEQSPFNKRHKYEGRIRGRPPLHGSRTCGVSSLRSSQSAEQHSLLKDFSMNQDENMNLSF